MMGPLFPGNNTKRYRIEVHHLALPYSDSAPDVHMRFSTPTHWPTRGTLVDLDHSETEIVATFVVEVEDDY